MMTRKFKPEGILIESLDNKNSLQSEQSLREAYAQGKILEARSIVCDSEHNLVVQLGCMKGIIPRIHGALGIDSGVTKDIAIISKVNKPVCFKIICFDKDKDGNTVAILSRVLAQQQCMEDYISELMIGDVIPARITHLENFGCFVDIGCGIPSLIPIDAISVSRISHPSDRFKIGFDIKAIVKSKDNGRITLTHKELLGNWDENAALFKAGETVAGVVRSIEEYGIFVELTPNLAGLAEPHENVVIGQQASVYIKNIIPEKMKVKLIIVDTFDAVYQPPNPTYFTNNIHINTFRYSSQYADRVIESFFE